MTIFDCSRLLSFDLKNFSESKGFGIGLALVLLLVFITISRIVMSVKAKKSSISCDCEYSQQTPETDETKEMPSNIAKEEIPESIDDNLKTTEDLKQSSDLPIDQESATVAAITVAIALILESEGSAPYGFRVVSFRRSNNKF